ncbi:DUF4232 domain-containing protein [Streptomyces sp. NPDC088194]|uniref:DUF4232 domain-containing protein n=1 Tax=Streptomyces sp. NPDC088194 TaxID=3154931 RepID=UPI00344D19B4
MRTTSSQSRRKAAGRHPLARTAPFAAAAVAMLALGAAGCGNSGKVSDTSARSTSPAASPAGGSGAAAPSGSAAPGSTATAGTVAPRSAVPGSSAPQSTAARPEVAGSRCAVTDLTMRLGRGDPGAGQMYYPLRFTNTSSRTCVLDGFPGVSLIRGDGSTIGKPAGREGPRGAAVGLKPGASVEADLHTLNQGVNGDSCWRRPTLLKAYPPGSKDAMTLATGDPVVCGGTFDVGSVH